MSNMPLSRAVSIVMDKFIRATVDPFIHPTRAGKQVHQFSHNSPSLIIFDGAFGEDRDAFRVQAMVRATEFNIFTMIDVVMMNQFTGNGESAWKKYCLVSCIISDSGRVRS